MSNGISQFAYTAPAPTASFGLAGTTGGTSGGSLSVNLPEISVGPEPDLGGGALPGDGSYGDPIAGFHQINQQFADSQRAFSERMDAQSAQFNTTQMQAQSDARAAQMQAQSESNMASMNAQRAAMFAPPAGDRADPAAELFRDRAGAGGAGPSTSCGSARGRSVRRDR
ncbi:hypothetical protein BK022_27720 [Methylorubrum extorquens]|uniref:Uncharacterized protein n=1 Tax=Methylorubrum extorquens TaxID=408 RepID=A0A1S1NIW8_METEX|nr:hypothetical protein BK022_27720 [Methylorubrum extorquens]